MTPWVLFAVTGVGVYAMRLAGALAGGREGTMPPLAMRALHLVVPAAVTAVAASAVMVDHGDLRAWGAWHLAALAAIAVTWWRRTMALTIAVGMVTFALARALGL